jgi:electron transfer flavoprotein beta subunit
MRLIVAVLGWAWRTTTVDPLTATVSGDPRDRGPSPADLAALEHALRLAQRCDARVVAATVAPRDADAMLRDALAAGASEVLRVEPIHDGNGLSPNDLTDSGRGTAVALADALRSWCGEPDLVLCGDGPADEGGSLPAFLAAELDAEQALGVLRIQPDNDSTLRVHRRLDGGRREVLLVRSPAVVSVEAAGVRLRRAALPAVLATRECEIPVAQAPGVSPAQPVRLLGMSPHRPRPHEIARPSGTALHRVLELTGALEQRTPPTVIGPLSPEDAVDELLDYLRRNGYLTADGAP